MFGICLQRRKKENGLVEYIPFLKQLSYSQHVKHDIPLVTSIRSESILKYIKNIPSMYSPYINLEKYLISPETEQKERIIPLQSSAYCPEAIYVQEMIRSLKDTFKRLPDEDIYPEVTKMKTFGIHIEKFTDLVANILPEMDENYTSSYYRSAGNQLMNFCKSCIINLQSIDIVPIDSNYSNIHEIAVELLKSNWNHNNVIRVCCEISDADESSFRSIRSAIYEVKPELKGLLKKTEDINDLDLDLFSVEDFMKEEYEFALISSMLPGIVLEEDFLKFSVELLHKYDSSDGDCHYVESNISEYISDSDKDVDNEVYAFLKYQNKPFYKNYNFNLYDYQVCADPGLENMWIIEYSLESKYQFKLYPLDDVEKRASLLSGIIDSAHDFYELSSENHTNSIERDRDRICTFVNSSSPTNTIPINLTASEIDKYVSTGTEKIVNIGKFGNDNNVSGYTVRTDINGGVRKVVPSATISVDNTEFVSYFCNYEPILKDDPTILEIKELIKGFGYSVPSGNKDVIIKRLSEVMANSYDKVEDDIAKMFDNDMIIVKGQRINNGNAIDLCKMLDRNVKSKIMTMPKNRSSNYSSGNSPSHFTHSNRCVNLVYPCFVIAYIMMHTYAGAIFMPSYKNRLITTKGCFDDLVLRSWGGGEHITMIGACGIGQYDS